MCHGCGSVCMCVCACMCTFALWPSQFLWVLGTDLEHPLSNGEDQLSERYMTLPQSHNRIGMKTGKEPTWPCFSFRNLPVLWIAHDVCLQGCVCVFLKSPPSHRQWGRGLAPPRLPLAVQMTHSMGLWARAQAGAPKRWQAQEQRRREEQGTHLMWLMPRDSSRRKWEFSSSPFFSHLSSTLPMSFKTQLWTDSPGTHNNVNYVGMRCPASFQGADLSYQQWGLFQWSWKQEREKSLSLHLPHLCLPVCPTLCVSVWAHFRSMVPAFGGLLRLCVRMTGQGSAGRWVFHRWYSLLVAKKLYVITATIRLVNCSY